MSASRDLHGLAFLHVGGLVASALEVIIYGVPRGEGFLVFTVQVVVVKWR